MNYIVVGSKPWNKRVFDNTIKNYAGNWMFIDRKEDFTITKIRSISPRYIFFLHWSYKVPNEIINTFDCVVFHMTDVPYGRGGSPLQNLIVRGHRQTKLTALKMSEQFDAGPIYAKQLLGLGGNAEEIYIRATEISAEMIKEIIEKEPEPIPQVGEPTVFKRRKPSQSDIVEAESLNELYNMIRMLDAEGYPKAFLEVNGFRFEFKRAALYEGKIDADVTIIPISPDKS